VRINQRRSDYEEHRVGCELTGEVPLPKATQGHISAAKLKGSPEYKQKMEKMTEKRERVKTHCPNKFENDTRVCGCEIDTTYFTDYCFFCAEYGNIQELRWVTHPKKPKQPIRDRPCPTPTMSSENKVYPSFRDVLMGSAMCEPSIWPRIGQYNDYYDDTDKSY
jgi:hypothetical protein